MRAVPAFAPRLVLVHVCLSIHAMRRPPIPPTNPPNQSQRTQKHRLEVPLSELEERAAELRIYDIRPFLASQLFRSHGLVVETVVDRGASVKMIRKLL